MNATLNVGPEHTFFDICYNFDDFQRGILIVIVNTCILDFRFIKYQCCFWLFCIPFISILSEDETKRRQINIIENSNTNPIVIQKL